MSFSSLLAGYAKSKVEPPVEKKSGPAPPKSHHLKPVLESIRSSIAPIMPSNKTSDSSQLNLGILVMIIDDFPNELLWRMWLQQTNTSTTSTSTEGLQESPRVRLWFHAKCPEKVRSPWVRERLVRGPTFKPEWGSIEITKVMAHMLHEALIDAPHINKFCFASESCIPIRSVDATLQCLYASQSTSGAGCAGSADGSTSSADGGTSSADGGEQAVYDVDSSWLCYTDVPNNGYAQQLQFDPLARALPAGCVHKASQWVLLSRVHAQAVIDLMQQVGDGSGGGARKGNTGSGGTAATGDCTAVATVPLPPLSSALFSAFALVIKASDEMFFPCCLAVVGAIGASSDSGAKVATATNTTSITDTTTDTAPATVATATTTTTTTTVPTVLRQQVTYCDWTNNAKSPHEYTTFPTPLVSALTNYNTTNTNTADSAASKKKLESLHIHPEQMHACFLRKIKFPIKYLNTSTSDSSGGISGGVDSTTVVFNEVQEVFLREWLPFVVNSSAGSDGTVAENVELYMQHARTVFSAIMSYPAPVRVINKRALPAEEEHSSVGSGGGSSRGGYSDGNSSRYNDNRGYGGGNGAGSGNSYGSRYGREDSRDRGRQNNYNNNYYNNNNSNNYNGGGSGRYNTNDSRYNNNQGYGGSNNGYSNKSPRY